MKRILAIVFLALALPLAAAAQAPTLVRLVNSQALAPGASAVMKPLRLTLRVQDGLPNNAGYVYEFGPVDMYRVVNGQRTLVKRIRNSEVFNYPVMNLSLSVQRDPDLTGDFELEVAWIKRYDAQNQPTTLSLTAAERTVSFVAGN